MKYTHEYIEGRIIWHTQRHYGFKKGNQGNIKLFKYLEPSEIKKFEAIINGSDMGVPTLLFLGRDKKWTLFGTKKVITGSFLGPNQIKDKFVRKYKLGEIVPGYESFSYANITMYYDLSYPIGPVFIHWYRQLKKENQIIIQEQEEMGVLYGPIKSEFECMQHIMKVLVNMYQKEIIPLVGLAAIK